MHRHADDVNKELKTQSFTKKKKKLLSLCQPMNEWITWSTIAIREFHSCPFNTISTFSFFFAFACWSFFAIGENEKANANKNTTGTRI